ncbi:MAG: hypothetical protein K6C34_02725 [Alphaproteobacteria bacterium]|nr:hypothetical protein [Alphaproteobacteria bacterium]
MQEETVNSLQGGFSEAIEKYLERYFALHNGAVPCGLYSQVMNEVERGVLNVTLKHTNMNQLQASKILGINRNTLRKKISSYKTGADK